MKKLIVGILIGVSSIGVTNVNATSQAGSITVYHLNSDNAYVGRDTGYGDRAVCVQMKPSVPTGGWACLYNGNRLYSEINQLLLNGYMNKKKCSISGTAVDSDGYLIINAADCS